MSSIMGGEEPPAPSMVEQVKTQIKRKYQYFVDRSVPYPTVRWVLTGFLVALLFLRVYTLDGWFIVVYGYGIFQLNLFIGFLSPQSDPEAGDESEPGLPVKKGDEFRPFVRKVPAFKFWYSTTKATLIAIAMTFFSVFNLPVYWPILLFYFLFLFGMTMHKQIADMKKRGYVPWNWGKKRYTESDRPKKDNK